MGWPASALIWRPLRRRADGQISMRKRRENPGSRKGKDRFPLQQLCGLRSLQGVRTNPTPAERVAAWYEDKETAPGNSREADGAKASPRDSQETQPPPPQNQPFQDKPRPHH